MTKEKFIRLTFIFNHRAPKLDWSKQKHEVRALLAEKVDRLQRNYHEGWHIAHDEGDRVQTRYRVIDDIGWTDDELTTICKRLRQAVVALPAGDGYTRGVQYKRTANGILLVHTLGVWES